MTTVVHERAEPAAGSSSPLIELRAVEKVYRTGKLEFAALRRVDLAIWPGEIVAVVGPSGSGKTTILNMITGIDRPTAGEVVVDGADLGAMTEERLARWRGQTVGIVFQFFQLLPTLTALENAALPMDFARRWKPGERWERARRHLDAVGLGDKGDHLPLEDMLTRRGYTSRSQIMYAGPANNKAQARSILLIVESIGLLIVAISMLGLVNAITMSIMERTREIGVLRCLDAPARDLRRIFRTETITLALIGFALAVPLGSIVAHVLRWLVLHLVNAQLPAPYPLGDLGFALIGTLLLAVLVVAVPVRRATRLRPGDAIRYH